MKRTLQGHHVTILAKEGTTQAFVPAVLPPRPPLQWTSALADQFAQAQHALQRVNRLSRSLRNPVQFLQAHLRRERLGQHPTEEFPEFHWFPDKHHAPYVLSRKELQEIVGYWVATQHGLSKLSRGAPFSVRLLREMHQLLLRKGRGCDKAPGEFRPMQNWVGAAHLEHAVFVPPPPYLIQECMKTLVRYLNHNSAPPLLKAALAHVQLESIHPFQDGNGRLGRLLVNLILCANQTLRLPLLPLGSYFKRHRQTYYERLNQVRYEGDWEAWLEFFAEGVVESAGKITEVPHPERRSRQRNISVAGG